MISKIFEIWEKQNPYPKTELEYSNLYTLLVAVVLSAQSTDNMVNKCTKNLFSFCDNPYEMIKLGEDNLKTHIKHIGLFNSKAKNIIELSKILIEKFNGKVPENFDDLVTLPGVGRKTANVVLNCWFNAPTMPVDTHIFRVAKRLNFSNGKTPLEVERDLLNNIPQKYINKAHHWMILHGRYICKSRKPLCTKCDISQFCHSEDKII